MNWRLRQRNGLWSYERFTLDGNVVEVGQDRDTWQEADQDAERSFQGYLSR